MENASEKCGASANQNSNADDCEVEAYCILEESIIDGENIVQQQTCHEEADVQPRT